jgi:hypothetical protein
MKKKLLCSLTSLFTALLFLSSCQKDIRGDDQQIGKQDPVSAGNITADKPWNRIPGKHNEVQKTT